MQTVTTKKLIKRPSKYCWVPKCNADNAKNSMLSFYRLPSGNEPLDEFVDQHGIRVKTKRREIWLRNLKMGDMSSIYATICSDHFEENCFIPVAGLEGHYRGNLKADAVPTLKLPKSSTLPKTNQSQSFFSYRDDNRTEVHRLLSKELNVNPKVEDSLSSSEELATSIDGLSKSMTTKSRINCCVYNCPAMALKNPNLSFHKFPSGIGLRNRTLKLKTKLGRYESVTRRIAWIKNCYSGKEITGNMKVCSRHFAYEDFSTEVQNKQRTRLKNTSVPTLNMPKPPYYLSPNEPLKTYDPRDIGKIELIDMNTSVWHRGAIKFNDSKLIRSSEKCGNFGLFVAHELSTIKTHRLRTKLKELITNTINTDL